MKGPFGQARAKKKGEPGCGKRLDSAAKSSEDGEVWCRECLVRSFIPFFVTQLLTPLSSYLEMPE